jgi:cell cycle checkpoint protein
LFVFLISQIDIPSNSEFVEVFDCKETQINRYKVNFIKHSLKALAASSKVAIRIAESGVMSIQFLIPISETSKMAFVEFYVTRFCTLLMLIS